MPLLFAMSFPCWRCVDCRNVVTWEEAIAVEYDEKLYGFRHAECDA